MTSCERRRFIDITCFRSFPRPEIRAIRSGSIFRDELIVTKRNVMTILLGDANHRYDATIETPISNLSGSDIEINAFISLVISNLMRAALT